MKLHRFFLSILAGAALAAGCAQEQVISTLAEFQVESSYLSIPLEGGIANTPIKATASWSFDSSTIPEWLTVERHGLHTVGQCSARGGHRSLPRGRGYVLLPRHCSTHDTGR